MNGDQDKSIIKDDTIIEFTTTFEYVGQEYVLDYEVTNGSKNYDAELEMVCTGGVYNIHATLVATGHGGGLNGYTANATIANYLYTTGYSGGGATQTSGDSTGIHGGDNFTYVSAMVGSFGAGGYDSISYSSSEGSGGYYVGGHVRIQAELGLVEVRHLYLVMLDVMRLLNLQLLLI